MKLIWWKVFEIEMWKFTGRGREGRGSLNAVKVLDEMFEETISVIWQIIGLFHNGFRGERTYIVILNKIRLWKVKIIVKGFLRSCFPFRAIDWDSKTTSLKNLEPNYLQQRICKKVLVFNFPGIRKYQDQVSIISREVFYLKATPIWRLWLSISLNSSDGR